MKEQRLFFKNEDGSVMTDRQMLNSDICPTCYLTTSLKKTSENLQKIGIRKVCSVCGVHYRY